MPYNKLIKQICTPSAKIDIFECKFCDDFIKEEDREEYKYFCGSSELLEFDNKTGVCLNRVGYARNKFKEVGSL